MAIVNLQDLQVTFGAKTAVSAASFRVDAGETFSLIGASGCGKSTILRVLAGLQREWRGSVELLGQGIAPAPLADEAVSLDQPALGLPVTRRGGCRLARCGRGLACGV